MSDEQQLNEWVVDLEVAQKEGTPLTPEDVAPKDRPDLLAELKKRWAEFAQLRGLLPTNLEPPRADETATLIGSGTRYGRFVVRKFHRQGGMGEVLLATDEELHREVALKRIRPKYRDDARAKLRFIREAEITSKLDHPGIVPVHGLVYDEDGQPCYAMRFVEGDTLEDAIAAFHKADVPGRDAGERSLAFRQLLQHFVALCKTIAYAHSRGVIHRDIKPGNVKLGKYGETLVVDWGLAKALEVTNAIDEETAMEQPLGTMPQEPTDSDVLTMPNYGIGSPGYVGPEQAAGNWRAVGPQSDVYSLGATLYTLLTGHVPIEGKTWAEVNQKTQRGDFPRPRQMKRDIPRALEAICLKAMAVKAEDRCGTAAELAAELEKFLADESVDALRDSFLEMLGRWSRKHRTLATSAAAVLLVATLGSMVGLFLVERERANTAKALVAETNARAAEKEARDRALAALRDMTDDIVENQMARGAFLTEENKEFLRKIITHFEGFAAVTADDADSRAIRAEGHYRVGRMRYRLGELKEAETDYAAAREIQLLLAGDFPTRPEFRQDLARSHGILGILLHNTGRLKEAETAYTDALALFKQLAADFPTRPEFRQGLARSHVVLGILLHHTGRPNEAEMAYSDALVLQKQLAADFPTRLEFRQELAGSHYNLGLLLSATGRLKEAETAHADALALKKQLAAEVPTRPEFRQNLARSHNSLGLLLRDMDRLEEAETAFADALALQKQLAVDFPARPEFRRELAVSHNNLGNVLSGTGGLKEAESAYSDALALQKQLAADFPNQPDLRNELANTCVNLAFLRLGQRDFRGAKAYLEEAVPHHESALKANPRNPSYRQFYRNHVTALIRTNAGLGDPAGAKHAAEKLRALDWDPPVTAYHAACCLSLCILVIQKDEKATKEDRDKQVRFYGDEAMKMLKEAVAKGYQNVEYMKKDTDLIPLWQREDFQELLAELEIPIEPIPVPPQPKP